MRVGVVGSGIAGLAAARTLYSQGVEVVVFEKEAWVGGRCRTLKIGDYTFDPGASSIVPRSRAIEEVILKQLDTHGLIKIERPVYTHDGRRVFQGVGLTPTPRFCYEQGIQRLADLLSNGLDVRFEKSIKNVSDMKIGEEVFDRIILAVPTPIAENLLASIHPIRKAMNTRYRSCISVLLAYDRPTKVDFHAVVSEESVHPLHWLSIENLKTPGRAPEGHSALVVQLGPKYSKWNFEEDDSKIVADALVDVTRVLGSGFDLPLFSKTVRWKYSQPDSVSSFESVNPIGEHIIIASDGLVGGRIEHAYEAGIKAAEHILDQ